MTLGRLRPVQMKTRGDEVLHRNEPRPVVVLDPVRKSPATRRRLIVDTLTGHPRGLAHRVALGRPGSAVSWSIIPV